MECWTGKKAREKKYEPGVITWTSGKALGVSESCVTIACT